MYIDVKETKEEVIVWERVDGKLNTLRYPISDFCYAFIPDNTGSPTHTNLFKEPMKQVFFDNKWKMRDFVQGRQGVCESDVSPSYKSLLELYHDCDVNEPYNVLFWDIEVDFDLKEGKGFPMPKNPFGEINSISCFDVTEKKFVMFIPSKHKQEIELKDKEFPVEIHWTSSERNMLIEFCEYIDHIDIMSAWNGCLTPDHRVLTEDLRYVPVGDLEVGDKLLAFDEKSESGKKRHWKSSVVLKNNRKMRDVYKITLSNGKTLKSTPDHPWFIPNYTRTGKANGYRYVNTEDLEVGMRFQRIIPEWETLESYDAGYLAGFFDGEGSIGQYQRKEGSSYETGHTLSISASQNKTVVLEQVREKMERLGYPTGYHEYDPSNRNITGIQLKGEMVDKLRFLGEVRPKRLLDRFDADKLSSMKRFNSEESVYVESIEYLGEMEIVELSTSSRTYISEGYGCHNCNYDIPYVMERLKHHFPADYKHMLCREGFNAKYREFTNEYGEDVWEWTLVGRFHLDLKKVFQKFVPGEEKSFALDAVCERELGERKVEFEDNLGELYRENPQKFFEYSLHDSRLLKMLDDKKQIVRLAVTMYRSMCALPSDVTGSVKIIEMGFLKYCREKGNIVLPDKKESVKEEFPGAIVYHTIAGKHGWMFSSDLTALYPSAMRMLGLSTENFIFQCQDGYEDYVRVMTKSDDEVEVVHIGSGETEVLTGKELESIIRSEGFTISANGSIFDGSMGLLSQFVEYVFNSRKKYKNMMNEEYAKGNMELYDLYDLYQKVYKIFANSLYGCISNAHFRLYDIRLAKSITLTGQVISKWQSYQCDSLVDVLKEDMNET